MSEIELTKKEESIIRHGLICGTILGFLIGFTLCFALINSGVI